MRDAVGRAAAGIYRSHLLQVAAAIAAVTAVAVGAFASDWSRGHRAWDLALGASLAVLALVIGPTRTRPKALQPAIVGAGVACAVCVAGVSISSVDNAARQSRPRCSEFQAMSASAQRNVLRREYPAIIHVLAQDYRQVGDAARLRVVLAAPGRPTSRQLDALVADAKAVCTLPQAFPDVEMTNAYLGGRRPFP